MLQLAARNDIAIDFGDNLFDDVYICRRRDARHRARQNQKEPKTHICRILPLAPDGWSPDPCCRPIGLRPRICMKSGCTSTPACRVDTLVDACSEFGCGSAAPWDRPSSFVACPFRCITLQEDRRHKTIVCPTVFRPCCMGLRPAKLRKKTLWRCRRNLRFFARVVFFASSYGLKIARRRARTRTRHPRETSNGDVLGLAYTGSKM